MTKTRKHLPARYFAGLSKTKKIQRKKEIAKFGALHWKDPKAYLGFKTDKDVKVKPSQYTKKWRSLFPTSFSLKSKSKATGVPLRFIRESYNRGLAAWRTGHRPGASEQAWGYARVHSFLLCGKTYETTDSDIADRAKKASKTAKRWWVSQCA